MKKLFTLSALFIATFLNSQSSLNVWALTPDQSATTTAVSNGDTLYYTVTSNTTLTVFFQFQNMSASTHSYSVRRTDIVLNKVAGSHAFFCFGDIGTCFPASQTLSSDYTTLGPGQATSQNSGPPFHADTHLSTDMQDSVTATYAVIKYKLFNVTAGESGPDTLSFIIIYNPTLSGINENKTVLKNVSEIYPNPATNQADITVVLTDESAVKVQVYNSLGSVVYSGAEQRMTGKNKIALDCNNFNSGLYFITVTAGNSKVTKRLVVNK